MCAYNRNVFLLLLLLLLFRFDDGDGELHIAADRTYRARLHNLAESSIYFSIVQTTSLVHFQYFKAKQHINLIIVPRRYFADVRANIFETSNQ